VEDWRYASRFPYGQDGGQQLLQEGRLLRGFEDCRCHLLPSPIGGIVRKGDKFLLQLATRIFPQQSSNPSKIYGLDLSLALMEQIAKTFFGSRITDDKEALQTIVCKMTVEGIVKRMLNSSSDIDWDAETEFVNFCNQNNISSKLMENYKKHLRVEIKKGRRKTLAAFTLPKKVEEEAEGPTDQDKTDKNLHPKGETGKVVAMVKPVMATTFPRVGVPPPPPPPPPPLPDVIPPKPIIHKKPKNPNKLKVPEDFQSELISRINQVSARRKAKKDNQENELNDEPSLPKAEARIVPTDFQLPQDLLMALRQQICLRKVSFSDVRERPVNEQDLEYILKKYMNERRFAIAPDD